MYNNQMLPELGCQEELCQLHARELEMWSGAAGAEGTAVSGPGWRGHLEKAWLQPWLLAGNRCSFCFCLTWEIPLQDPECLLLRI